MEIVIYLYNGITALDAVGPYEVLSRLPDANIKFVGETKGPIVSDSHFLKLVADYEISEIERADILLIPGSVIGFVREAKKEHVKDWIRRIHQTTQWTVSVCTGSIILASTGLLQGLKASSHWAAIHLLKDYGARVGTICKRREDHYLPGRIRRDRHELIPGFSNRWSRTGKSDSIDD